MRPRLRTWNGFISTLLLTAAIESQAAPTSDTGVVRFAYADTTATQVFLAGDFNGWSQTATPLDREDSGWVTRVFLDPGVYEYKFFADGQWKLDAGNPERSLQGNSVVRVGADGEVLPPRPSPGAAGVDSTGAPQASRDVVGSIRYLGFATVRRDPALDRWDLDRALHDVDVRFDARIAPELSAYALANLTNAADSTSATTQGGTEFTLRYDRGQIEWAPGSSTLRLFDNVAVADFDDPAALVGRIGIYGDPFGYRRRGLDWRQRILGARLEIVYADDTEPPTPRPGVPFVGDVPAAPETYVTSTSQRGADAFAARVKGGTDTFGVGVVARSDRGRYAGQLLRTTTAGISPDTVVTSGEAFDTTERSESWGIDLRGRFRDLRFAAEVLDGRSRANASSVVDVTHTQTPDTVLIAVGVARQDGSEFALDGSRRAIVALRWARFDPRTAPQPPWSARPGTGRLALPKLAYAYEEHDFTALGAQAAIGIDAGPFLQSHHEVQANFGQRFGSVDTEIEVEQHWFRYPDPRAWQTQFWFRQRNFWLDEDVTSVERLTLLGAPTASIARLHAASPLWSRIALRGELHVTYAAPGFEHAPRYTEGILQLAVPLMERLELRTHSRLAVYRQFETSDPSVVALLGPGKHFEAGLPAGFDVDATHSYRALSAHFIELVAAITTRSDVALGFGVDPFVVYEITNEYAPIGWDSFLFASGASPADAFANPIDLGRRLEAAERALESERRVTLEARLRF